LKDVAREERTLLVAAVVDLPAEKRAGSDLESGLSSTGILRPWEWQLHTVYREVIAA
jgi:hypothetical protein